MHCARSEKKTDVVYQYTRHLCSIDGGSSACGIYMSISLYVYRSAIPLHITVKLIYFTICLFLLCSKAFGIYMCISLYIYRSAIPLNLAIKLICITIGLFILLSKDFIIRTKRSIYMDLFILICLILVVVVVVLLVVV